MKNGPNVNCSGTTSSSILNRFRLATRLLFVSILAANIFVLGLYATTLREDHNLLEQDFLGYYTASSLPTHAMYNIERQREFQTRLLGRPYGVPAGVLLFNHPPLLVPLVRLVKTDDYVESYRRWVATLFLISVLCSLTIYLLLRNSGKSLSISLLCAFSAFLFYPLYRSIEIGTDTVVVLLGVLLSTFFLSTKKDVKAGLVLGLTVIKPHLAVILAAGILPISRRAFVMFVAAGSLLTILSVAYVGPEGVLDLLRDIKLSTQGETLGVFYTRQYNFMGLLARMGLYKSLVSVIGWSAFAAVTIFVAFIRSNAKEESLALVLLLAVFFAPNLHFHDLALLLLPMTIIAARLKDPISALAFFPFSPVAILAAGLSVAGYSIQALGAAALRYCSRARWNVGATFTSQQ